MDKTAEEEGQSSTGQRLVIASKALRGQNALLLADGDLLGGAVHLTADTFGDLLDFPARLQEGFDLCVDRSAGFSTAGAGLGLLLDAFTRMTAINLFKN